MASSKNSSSQNSSKNRLIGWLISYEMDEMGKAYEIRAGRTLIGSNGSGSGRLITLETKGISSPHLAMNASAKHRLMAQDIFSDTGSFISRGDSADENPISGPTELRHGDWLRVGTSTRFQVCLIDGVSR